MRQIFIFVLSIFTFIFAAENGTCLNAQRAYVESECCDEIAGNTTVPSVKDVVDITCIEWYNVTGEDAHLFPFGIVSIYHELDNITNLPGQLKQGVRSCSIYKHTQGGYVCRVTFDDLEVAKAIQGQFWSTGLMAKLLTNSLAKSTQQPVQPLYGNAQGASENATLHYYEHWTCQHRTKFQLQWRWILLVENLQLLLENRRK